MIGVTGVRGVGGPVELGRGRAWALAVAATLTMAVSYVDRQAFSFLAPRVTQAFDISEAGYAWLSNGFSIAYLLGAPLAGRIIDRVGARRGLLGAVLVWSTIAALHALVPSFAVLFVLRLALGLSESPSFPGAAQIIQRALPPGDRARGFGLLFTGSSLGAAIAAPLATSAEHAYGFRVAFLVTAAVGLLWVPMWLALSWGRAARTVLDTVPATAATPGRPTLGVRGLLTHVAMIRAIAATLASAPLFAFGLVWGAKYLVRDHALAPHETGRYLWLPMVAFDVGALAFGHLASLRLRRPGHELGSPPLALVTIAMLLGASLALTPLTAGPWAASVVLALAHAGSGGLYALSTADLLARVPQGDVSTAGGIVAASQSLAIVIVNPLVASAVVASGSYSTSLVALGLWTLPGCLLWLLVRPPRAIA